MPPADLVDDVGAVPVPVTDTHLHLWDRSGGGYRWLEGAPAALRRDATWEQVAPQLVARGVTRVVLVQADDTLEDTRFLTRTAPRIEAESGPVARVDVVGWLPLADPGGLERLLEDPGAAAVEGISLERLVGVRHLIHDEPAADFLDRPSVRESLALLARHGLPLDVPDAFPRHLDQAAAVAGEVEGLPLVLDHLGKPPLGEREPMRRWEAQLREVAARPLAVAKVSGLSRSGRGYEDAGALRHVLEVALEAFGADRLMYGSDWPIAPVPFEHETGADPLREALGALTAPERGEILSGTAQRVYRRAGERPAP